MRKSDSMLSSNWLLVAALVLLWPTGWLAQDSGLLDSYVLRILMLIGIRVIAAVSLQLINGISGQFSLGHAGFMAIGAYFAAYPSIHYSNELTDPVAVLGFYVAAGTVATTALAVAGACIAAVTFTQRIHPVLPAIGALLLLGWFFADLAMAPYDLPYIGRALDDGGLRLYVWSWLLHALGAMFSWLTSLIAPWGSNLSAWVPASFLVVICYFILLVFGGLCAAAAGLAVGIPALRLRGDYLAIATLGFAEIVRASLEASPAVGGALGLTGVPRVPGFAWVFGTVVITTTVIWRLLHSARGRAMLAVREDEIAAGSLGVHPARSKVLAFVVGAFFAGVSGVLLAHYEGFITPANFSFMQSVELVVIVTLAGTGSITGTIAIAALLTFLPEFLRDPLLWANMIASPLGLEITLPDAWQEWMRVIAENRLILYALVLITIMILRPNGIFGNRELFRRRRRAAEPEVVVS